MEALFVMVICVPKVDGLELDTLGMAQNQNAPGTARLLKLQQVALVLEPA